MLLSMTDDSQTTRSINWDDARRSAMAPGAVLRRRYRLDGEALHEAVGAQLITADGEDAFTFTHDKIREVLYEELNPARRRYHRLAAEGFERRRSVGGAPQYPAEKLAYHYIQTGDYEHGLVYARQAAAEAERVFAFDEAIAA